MKKGDSGPEVRDLQVRLSAVLRRELTLDGEFGPATERAVKDFQRQINTLVDGVVGPITMAALRAATPAEMPPFDSTFMDGWYRDAIRVPCHPGRVGRVIDPYITVVHTTDMYPGTMAALLKSWASGKGKGNAAHFLLGRTPHDGVEGTPTCGLVQMIPINHNGNHAGGGGSFTVGGSIVHPNSVSVGIEIDCAGRLGKPRNGKWYYPGSLRTIPDEDVFVDEKGVGWHRITEYQYQTLGTLLTDLHKEYRQPPGTVGVLPKGTYKGNGVPWGEITIPAWPGQQIVGHVTLNPTDKTDPSPPMMAWLSRR